MTFLQALIGLHAPLQLEVGLRIVLGLTVIGGGGLALRRLGAAEDPVSAHRLLSAALLGMIVTPLIAVTLPALPIAYDLPGSFARIDNAPHMGPVRLAIASWLGADGVAASSGAFRGPGPLAWLTLAWMAGALALGVRQAIGFRRLRFPAAWREVPPRILPLVERARREAGIDGAVRVVISDAYDVPVTFGWRRPFVLLPADSTRWRDTTLTAALQHELSHVARRDWCWQIIGLAACALFWFHPLVWLVAREQRRTAELAADAEALDAGIRASTYARALLEVATGQSAVSRHPGTTIALSPASTLERRIAALAGSRVSGRAVAGTLLFVLLAIVVATGVSAPVHSAGCHAEALAAAASEPI